MHTRTPTSLPTALILAAGSSSRLGRSKQLLVIDGEPLLSRTIRVFRESGIEKICIVLGANEETHRRVIPPEVTDIIVNRLWPRGMGTSIRAGMKYLMRRDPDTDSVIIAVCDQPLLSTQVIQSIIEKYRSTHLPIVAARYANTNGVPVLFNRSHFEGLLALPDDQGARRILLQHPDDIAVVAFRGGELDLDTPDDYANFLKNTPET